jgi:predicted nuclease with RNAse H fold
MKRIFFFFLLSSIISLPALLRAASWLELRSPHFIMRYQSPEQKLAAFLLQKAEDTRETCQRTIGSVPPSPCLIYLAPSWEAFQEAQPAGEPPSWSVGTAYPGLDLICLRSPRGMKGSETDIEVILRHEYAHLALATALRGNEAPQWLDEGFAMLQSRGWNLSWTYIMSRGVLANALIPLEELVDGFPLDEHQAELAYAEGFSFVSFIKTDYGPDALPRLIRGLSNGLDAETALRQATGLGLRDLQRRWKEELKRSFSWIPIVTSFFSLWFLATLLFLLSYWLKRRKTKKTLEAWEKEEILTSNPLLDKRNRRLVVGIDLAGSPRRNTGACALAGETITSCTILHTDQEIIEYIEKEDPVLVAVDAPLKLPPGRKTIEDKNGEHFRPCDRELLRRRIPFFPITLGPMRLLTARGIRLKKALTSRGYSVIEVYPGAAQDIWNIGRKQDGLSTLSKGLKKRGVKRLDRKMSGDELDAITAALVGQLFLRGKAEVIGSPRRGAIIIPYPEKRVYHRRQRNRAKRKNS